MRVADVMSDSTGWSSHAGATNPASALYSLPSVTQSRTSVTAPTHRLATTHLTVTTWTEANCTPTANKQHRRPLNDWISAVHCESMLCVISVWLFYALVLLEFLSHAVNYWLATRQCLGYLQISYNILLRSTVVTMTYQRFCGMRCFLSMTTYHKHQVFLYCFVIVHLLYFTFI